MPFGFIVYVLFFLHKLKQYIYRLFGIAFRYPFLRKLYSRLYTRATSLVSSSAESKSALQTNLQGALIRDKSRINQTLLFFQP
ncbi:hypothetical protein D3P09_15775 [Paenibacillus pinisoli]|uniref:Uncharacterized protein n=1 Tax=Paenibacillus pinisoli TaxID=1276110 RepID=A0A3A6PYY1_9BACL|nr:hypothetical protein D3P09_15775 [Paenibacillus pinisoli]